MYRLTIDYENSKLYWTDNEFVFQMDQYMHCDRGFDTCYGITVSDQTLYCTDYKTKQITKRDQSIPVTSIHIVPVATQYL